MKKLALFAISILPLLGLSANAGEFQELGKKMSAARSSYTALKSHKDQRGADQQQLVKDTADAVSAQLAKMQAPAGKEAQFRELVETWKAFKETREMNMVPALLKGNDEAANQFTDVQRERITRCLILAGELDI